MIRLRFAWWQVYVLGGLILLVGCTAPTQDAIATDRLATTEVALPSVTASPLASVARQATAAPQAAATDPPAAFASFQGVGTGTTAPFSLTSIFNRVSFTHTGQGEFLVKARYPNGSNEYLKYVTGSYHGSRLLRSTEGYFDIEADGGWSVQIEALGNDETGWDMVTGTGDYVSPWFTSTKGTSRSYHFRHAGAGAFYVQLHCTADHLYLINETGIVEGTAVAEFTGGECLWDVQADGPWQIEAASSDP